MRLCSALLLLLCALIAYADEPAALTTGSVTRVPLRALVMDFNGNVAAGKAGAITVTLAGHNITLTAKSAAAQLDGKPLALPVPVIAIGDTTYVPLAMFSAIPEITVAVGAATHDITLSMQGADTPVVLPHFREKLIFAAGGGIYAMDPDGGNRVQLVEPKCGATQPVVNSLGDHIAYVANNEVVVMNADGSDRKAITTNKKPVAALSFRADGMTLLFTLARRDICSIHYDGSDQRTLLQSADGESYSAPAWNREGTAIAFVHWNKAGEGNLQVVDFNDSTQATLTESRSDYTEVSSPSFNAEGKSVLFGWFNYGDFGLRHGNIFSVEVASGKLKLLAEAEEGRGWSLIDPIYTPDGRILYKSLDWTMVETLKGTQATGTRYTLMIMNANGAGKRRLTKPSAQSIGGIAFNPLGAGFVFVQGGDLYALDLNGGTPRQLTKTHNCSAPSWALVRL